MNIKEINYVFFDEVLDKTINVKLLGIVGKKVKFRLSVVNEEGVNDFVIPDGYTFIHSADMIKMVVKGTYVLHDEIGYVDVVCFSEEVE